MSPRRRESKIPSSEGDTISDYSDISSDPPRYDIIYESLPRETVINIPIRRQLEGTSHSIIRRRRQTRRRNILNTTVSRTESHWRLSSHEI